MLIQQKRQVLYLEIGVAAILGIICSVLAIVNVITFSDVEEFSIFFLGMSPIITVLGLAIMQIIRSVRKIEIDADMIRLIYWKKCHQIRMGSLDGYSVGSGRLSPQRGQGFILYDKRLSYEIFDYQMEELFPLIEALKEKRVEYLGEEFVWYPYLSRKHRFSEV